MKKNWRAFEGGAPERQNVACGDGNLRVRRWTIPQATMAISAGDVSMPSGGCLQCQPAKRPILLCGGSGFLGGETSANNGPVAPQPAR